MSADADAEVLIVGAGTVGSTLACALGQEGVNVALVEAKAPQNDWPEGSVDLRVFAITRASQQIFTAVGAWESMRDTAISPFRHMYVWDSAGSGSVYFDCAELGEPVLGHIIEQRVIQRALWRQLGDLPGVSVHCPAQITDLEIAAEGVRLQLDDGTQLRGALVVGADGADSMVRNLAGLHQQVQDYHQQGLVAVVETELHHGETARQRFLPSGPLAFLPLRDGRCSIVWSSTTERAQELLAMEEDEFCVTLGEAFDHALGEIRGCGPRVAFPLRRTQAPQYVDRRVALIGDAAHTIHPLAGQGVNLGMLDCAALAEVLLEAKSLGRDPGGLATLRRFERWRKADNLAMATAMDGFKHLFGSSDPSLSWLRNTGLNLVDAVSPVKNRFMRHAMGLEGDLPKMARQ